MELTAEEIERQDYVDNTIINLLNDLNPSDQELEWDINIIGEIRDTIQSQFVERGLCSEQEFYP